MTSNYKGVPVDNTSHIYIRYVKHIEEWLSEPFNCFYCKLETNHQKSMGKGECRFHAGHAEYCDKINRDICTHCLKSYGTDGCVRCDHTKTQYYTHVDPKTNRINDATLILPFIFTNTLLDIDRTAWHGKPDISIKKKQKIAGEKRKFNEIEDLNHLESHLTIVRFDITKLIKDE